MARTPGLIVGAAAGGAGGVVGGEAMRGTFWTEAEDRELVRLRNAGDSLRQIASQIEGRSFNGVNGRLRRLVRDGEDVL